MEDHRVRGAFLAQDPQNVLVGLPVVDHEGLAGLLGDGDVTAEDVEIEVVLTAGGAEERSAVVIALVPHGSKRRGWVGFKQDPTRAQMHTRVVGYREP